MPTRAVLGSVSGGSTRPRGMQQTARGTAPLPLDPRLRRMALVGIGLLALALRVYWIDDPFWPRAGDWHGLFGSWAIGGPARAMAEHGWGVSAGVPYRSCLPLADGSASLDPYLHHPAATYLLASLSVKVWGAHAFALRLVVLPFSMLLVDAGWRLGRDLLGERGGLATALLLAVMPLTARETMQVCTEAPVVPFLALALAAYARWWGTQARASLWRAAGFVFVATLFDWLGAFLLPGLLAHALLARRPRRVLAAWPLWLAPGAAALVHALHVVVGTGAGTPRTDAVATLRYVTRWPDSVPGFFTSLFDSAVATCGPEVLLLAALGLVVGLGRVVHGARLSSWVLLASLPGLLYVMSFPFWGRTHHYLLFASALGVALGAAAALRHFGRWDAPSSGARRYAALGLLLALAGAGAWRTHARVLAWRPPLHRPLAAEPWLRDVLADPKAVVLGHPGRGYEIPFSSRAATLFPDTTRGELTTFLGERAPRLAPDLHLWFLMDLVNAPMLPSYPRIRALLEQHGDSTVHAYPGGSFELFDLGPTRE